MSRRVEIYLHHVPDLDRPYILEKWVTRDGTIGEKTVDRQYEDRDEALTEARAAAEAERLDRYTFCYSTGDTRDFRMLEGEWVTQEEYENLTTPLRCAFMEELATL
jgi:hypothetical protein